MTPEHEQHTAQMAVDHTYEHEQEFLSDRASGNLPPITPERWAELEAAYASSLDAIAKCFSDDPDEWHNFMYQRAERGRIAEQRRRALESYHHWFAEYGTPDNYWQVGRHIDVANDEETDRRDREASDSRVYKPEGAEYGA